MWIANKEHFSKPSWWNAFIFLLPSEHSCIVRTLQGCSVHRAYLTSAFGIHCGDQLLQFRLLVFTRWEQMFPLLPLGAPALQAVAPVPRHWKSRRGARREVPSVLFYSKCWTGKAALSSLELQPSLSGHLPESTSLSCLKFATKASHPKTLAYSASFEQFHDLPPLHRVLIVMSL